MSSSENETPAGGAAGGAAGPVEPPPRAEAGSKSDPPASGPTSEPPRPGAEDDGAPDEDGEEKTAEADAEAEEKPLLTRGNPLRGVRGGITAAAGCLFTFVLMAHSTQWRFGVPLGFCGVLVGAWGLMDLLGTFDDPDDRVAGTTTFATLRWPLLQMLAALGFFSFALMGGQSGAAKQWIWGVLVTVGFVALVASVFDLGAKLGPWAKDELGLDRPLLRRHGFWLMVIAALLYLPTLGMFSLWDPWETHYGEVAREILARDDWISLWWAQDGWFWSKPILNFWIQSLSMATLGTHYLPDQMLIGHGGLAVAHPEWVVRAPNFLMTVAAMYLLYKGVAKVFGRRAGFLGGVVLATMPDWYFLAHQTMTDMPFVAAMTAAMGLLLLGVHTDENALARVWEVDVGKTKWRLSAWHLVFGLVLVCALPQVLYLLSRNVELVLSGNGPYGFRNHWDVFRSGSGGGNCGLPGNEACVLTNPASIPKNTPVNPEGFGPSLVRFFGAVEPSFQALIWAAILGAVLYMNWGERRVRRLYYLAAWFAAAISTMAKGPAGFLLPMLCGFAYLATKKRFSELLQIELLGGVLLILGVALPWYVAMYVRHGSPFTDRLIFHDMFNRAFHHVHDTNEGDDTSFRFYVWQLGYALFPWTGLAPLGLLYWVRRGDSADRGRGDASVFLVMWFLFAFALFSFMGTKFHHYIFPAVPPVAMLVGVVLDDMLGDASVVRDRRQIISYCLVVGGAVAVVVALATHFAGGSLQGYASRASNMWIVAVGVLVAVGGYLARGFLARHVDVIGAGGAGTAAVAATPTPSSSELEPRGDAVEEVDVGSEARAAHEQLMLAAAAVAGAFLLGLVGRDLAIKPENADQPGAIRLLQLFTYNYRRPWPDNLDYGAALTVFTGVAVVLALLLAVKKLRHHAVVVFSVFAFVWALWGLDAYMMETSPHWGQHELLQAYYENRASPDEPFVAYQMNWKGENFYTGNHVPAFVSSGATFTTWIKQQKEKGVHVMYFVTEHSRVGGLKAEVGARAYREMTTKELCNKFVVVRAEL